MPPVGSTYNNHQVRAASAESVIAACQAAKIGPAQVSRVSGGWVTVLTDTLDIRGLKQLMLEGSRLSNRVGAPVLTTLVNDSDRLSYWLHDCGPLTDEFDSSPGKQAGAKARERVRGRPELFGPLLKPGATVAQLSAALDRARQGHADDAHQLLAQALGVDGRLVAASAKYIERRSVDADVLELFQRVEPTEDSPKDYLNKKLVQAVGDLDIEIASVQSLIAKGADVNTIINPAGHSLLMRCAQGCGSRCLEIAGRLIQAGADVNYQLPEQRQPSAHAMLRARWGTEEGATALIFAAEVLPPRRPEAFMKLLIEAGADINAKTATGRTALSAAAALGDPEFYRKLTCGATAEQLLRAKEASEARISMLRAAGAKG